MHDETASSGTRPSHSYHGRTLEVAGAARRRHKQPTRFRDDAPSYLLRRLAALHGQIWNVSQIGQSLGLSYHTVNGYLDFLAGAFLTRRLQPYQANLRKRLVKSPKVYWRDTGLLHALLSLADQETLLSHPGGGASWEGFIVEQALGALGSRGAHFDAYYFRTADGHEIDLVLERGKELWPSKSIRRPRPHSRTWTA